MTACHEELGPRLLLGQGVFCCVTRVNSGLLVDGCRWSMSMVLGKVSLNRHDLSSENRKIIFAFFFFSLSFELGVCFVFGTPDYCGHLP